MKAYLALLLAGGISCAWGSPVHVLIPTAPLMPYILLQLESTEDVGSRVVTVQRSLWNGAIEDVGSRVVTIQYDPFAMDDLGSRILTVDGTCNLTVNYVFAGLVLGAAPPTQVTVEYSRTNEAPFLIATETLVTQAFQRSVPTRTLVRVRTQQVSTFLSRAVTFDLRSGSANIVVPLINGDVNGDNEVGPQDFTGVLAAFGTEAGAPDYAPNADLNKDGEVGPADFSIVLENFGQEGN